MEDKINLGKRAAGNYAASLVKDGMNIGLGTGSTAYWAIMKLGEMVAEGLKIKALATSSESEDLARKLNIPITTFAETEYLDLDIDGADEADAHFNLIKGGGGALLREKIIATISKKMVVVADERKCVETLGKFKLPIEVVPFGLEATTRLIRKQAKNIQLRQKNGKTYVTDNGNFILDCDFYPIQNPKALHAELNNLPGVVENGLFIDLAKTLIIGKSNGEVEVRNK